MFIEIVSMLKEHQFDQDKMNYEDKVNNENFGNRERILFPLVRLVS